MEKRITQSNLTTIPHTQPSQPTNLKRTGTHAQPRDQLGARRARSRPSQRHAEPTEPRGRGRLRRDHPGEGRTRPCHLQATSRSQSASPRLLESGGEIKARATARARALHRYPSFTFTSLTTFHCRPRARRTTHRPKHRPRPPTEARTPSSKVRNRRRPPTAVCGSGCVSFYFYKRLRWGRGRRTLGEDPE